MNLEERSRLRKQRMTAHRANNHDDAELWDLMFWQAQSAEERLSALVRIHKDVEKVMKAKNEVV